MSVLQLGEATISSKRIRYTYLHLWRLQSIHTNIDETVNPFFESTHVELGIPYTVGRNGCIALHYYVHFLRIFSFRHSWDRK